MKKISQWILASALGATLNVARADKVELAGMQVDDRVSVAGSSLKLNGAGVGLRFVFKVYLIGLYLPEPKSRAEDILQEDSARRMVILMLRDVSADQFSQALAEASAPDEATVPPANLHAGLALLARKIANRPRGLRKGDVLTLDWVPGTGAVVQINGHSLMEPVPDKGFYAGLLNIWIGPRPTDPLLKSRLLGRAHSG
jgi:Chalcone isomerase-like